MNTVERVKQECKRKKVPISKLEKGCGFANGYIGKLREGTMPADRLKKVADYLDVSYLYLLDGVMPIEDPVLTAEEKKVLMAYRNANEQTKDIIRKILDMKKDASVSLTEVG